MFYETATKAHGLPRDPFKACIVPRPIGWISTLDGQGRVNLAPYSFFNGVASDPPMVMFASSGAAGRATKDTQANCEATGAFVANIVTWDLREAMNRTSAPVAAGIDEMDLAGLETAPARLVEPPRVKAAPIHLECLYHRTVDLPCDDPGGRNAVVFGKVIGIHIDDAVLTDGLVDVAKIRPIARLGYMDYTSVESVFAMRRPGA